MAQGSLKCIAHSALYQVHAVCHIYSGTNIGESRLLQRIPECFIPHIRPPGLASSNLVFPHAGPSGDAAGDLSFDSLEGGLKRTDSNLSSLLSSVDFTEDREHAVGYMEGNFQVRCRCPPCFRVQPPLDLSTPTCAETRTCTRACLLVYPARFTDFVCRPLICVLSRCSRW